MGGGGEFRSHVKKCWTNRISRLDGTYGNLLPPHERELSSSGNSEKSFKRYLHSWDRISHFPFERFFCSFAHFSVGALNPKPPKLKTSKPSRDKQVQELWLALLYSSHREDANRWIVFPKTASRSKTVRVFGPQCTGANPVPPVLVPPGSIDSTTSTSSTWCWF